MIDYAGEDKKAGPDRGAKLAEAIRARLGPPPALAETPLVSVICVNRNGESHLRRLLGGLLGKTDYPSLELIVVDNGSTDDSVEFIRKVATPFPVSILVNRHNESFSDACNQGAEQATGELLLFLNNDIEPFEPGWLVELVHCLRSEGAGIAGSTLVKPDETAPSGFCVQHRAIRLAEENGSLGPDRSSFGADPLDDRLGEDEDTPIAVGACILIEAGLFEEIDGFTHGYMYGGEDIDLGLKVWAHGRAVRCSGRSVLIHRIGSTRARDGGELQRARTKANRRLLSEYWAPRLRREYELDRVAGRRRWAADGEAAGSLPQDRERALALGFCLESSEKPPPAGEVDRLELLRRELERFGHRCRVFRGKEIEHLECFEYDVAIHLRGSGRYVPRSGQLNVLWISGDSPTVPTIECSRSDLVLSESSERTGLLAGDPTAPPVLTIDSPPIEDADAGSGFGSAAARIKAAVETRVVELDFPLRVVPH